MRRPGKAEILIGTGVVVATASGALAGWFFAKGNYETKLREIEATIDAQVETSVAYVLSQMDTGVPIVVTNEDAQAAADRINDSTPPLKVDVIPRDQVPDGGERVFPEVASLDELAQRNQATRYDQISQADLPDEEPEKEKMDADLLGEVSWQPGEDISVISQDLFIENPSGFDQETITLFSDGELLDSQSELLPNKEELIGEGIPPFGQQSNDNDCVYLRNKKLKREFEVIRDSGAGADFLMHSLQERFGKDRRRP